METAGLSNNQAPARSEARKGPEINVLVQGAETTVTNSRVPQAVASSADSQNIRNLKREEDNSELRNPPQKLFADMTPRIPVDMSAAERTAVYAQLFGINAADANDAANKLFLTAKNLFKPDA